MSKRSYEKDIPSDCYLDFVPEILDHILSFLDIKGIFKMKQLSFHFINYIMNNIDIFSMYKTILTIHSPILDFTLTKINSISDKINYYYYIHFKERLLKEKGKLSEKTLNFNKIANNFYILFCVLVYCHNHKIEYCHIEELNKDEKKLFTFENAINGWFPSITDISFEKDAHYSLLKTINTQIDETFRSFFYYIIFKKINQQITFIINIDDTYDMKKQVKNDENSIIIRSKELNVITRDRQSMISYLEIILTLKSRFDELKKDIDNLFPNGHVFHFRDRIK